MFTPLRILIFDFLFWIIVSYFKSLSSPSLAVSSDNCFCLFLLSISNDPPRDVSSRCNFSISWSFLSISFRKSTISVFFSFISVSFSVVCNNDFLRDLWISSVAFCAIKSSSSCVVTLSSIIRRAWDLNYLK